MWLRFLTDPLRLVRGMLSSWVILFFVVALVLPELSPGPLSSKSRAHSRRHSGDGSQTGRRQLTTILGSDLFFTPATFLKLGDIYWPAPSMTLLD